jgi:maleamate amidohydrolase
MSEALRENYAGVFDGRLPPGRRPALIVVDFVRAYTEPNSPLHAPAVSDAVTAAVPLLAAARSHAVPVFYTRVVYHPGGRDGGLFVRKILALRMMIEGAALAEIVPELAPAPDDVVFVKQYASAFFGTGLAPALTALRVDTLIITGCSTSGCVRATAVDAMQHGFLPIVVRECVADRRPEPHAANLFDIQAKYGEVMSRDEVMHYLATID